MPMLRIDNRTVDVPEGTTILQAARLAGIAIPTLCHLEGLTPSTSCFVCVVKVNGQERLLPSCATLAQEGMIVESQTDEVRRARRTALELLLSDHLGDCLAPCQVACPAGMNIPRMIRQLASGDLRGAVETVKADIALPAALGRICPAPCERACRRGQHDAALSICLLKRHAADEDLATSAPYRPPQAAPTGKRVAVVGAGPAGLSSAYYLAIRGHACTVFDEHEQPGGMLRYGVEEARLPRDVLAAEIATLALPGVDLRLSAPVRTDPSLEDLRRQFDAVVVAAGKGAGKRLDLPVGPQGVQADRRTLQTPLAGVFAVGEAVRPGRLAVRAVADGKAVAVSAHQYLAGLPVTGPPRPFSVHIGRVEPEEMREFLKPASQAGRVEPAGPGALGASGYSVHQARDESARCLHCDCGKPDACKLRLHADACEAQTTRFRDARRTFRQFADHPLVIYEPGKCIACGLCIQVARRAGEELGLTFVGRGFNVRVAVPLGESLQRGLAKAAAECAAACPTGAIVLKEAGRPGLG